MVKNKNRTKLFVVICILFLLLPISFNFTLALNMTSQPRGPRNVVAGPIELIKNGDLSTNQFWTFEKYDNLIAYYESTTNSANVTILTPVIYFGPQTKWDYGYINQSISKIYLTRNTPSAVNLNFDYTVLDFDGIRFGVGSLTGYVRAYINETQNPTPVYSQQVNINTKVPTTTVNVNVGDLIYNSGPYLLSLQFQIYVNLAPGSSHTFDKCHVRFDNISLQITDKYPPDVIVNQKTYGPYNSTDPGSIIDVDFLYGDGGNNTIDIGSYKIGSGGNWLNVFTQDTDSYTTDWGLDWPKVAEGNNTIYLRCNDTIGNSNDTEYFYVFKDSQLPQSQANTLPGIVNTSSVSVSYTSSDPAPSGGLHHVELWYADKGLQNFVKYTNTTCTKGNFTENPITFNSTKDGEFDFYTIAVDNANNREVAVPTSPDATIMIDTTSPTSMAGPLAKYQVSKTFNVPFTASDALSGVKHVNLYYTDDDGQTWTKHQSGAQFNFTTSPITFTAPQETKYGLLTVALDNATNIEQGGIPTTGTIPDVNTTINTKIPTPKIINPLNHTHHTGKMGIKVLNVTAISDLDTKKVVFDYYNDTDNNSQPDDGNVWTSIGTDEDPGYGWNVNWDISSLNADNLLVRANATDYSNKSGEGINIDIEIDNTDPIITITSPTFGDSFANICEIEFTTSADTARVIFEYWHNVKWNDIDIMYNPEITDSYIWESSFTEITTIELRATAYDEVNLSGLDKVEDLKFGLNPPTISDDFTSLQWTWEEDFTQQVRILTEYESDIEDSGENLKWYVTGHNKSIYKISGNNRTDDTFTFTSLEDMWGSETITFHLWDTDKLEAKVSVLVTITPINDAPEFTPEMSNSISIKAGQPYIWDLSTYIVDVDNIEEELTLTTTDPTNIAVNGLELTLGYGEDKLGETVSMIITVQDPGGLKDEKEVEIKISDNFPPEVSLPLPDLVFNEGDIVEDYIYLNDHFTDQDGESLTYSHNAKNIDITIDQDGSVDFTAEGWNGIELVTFKAIDPHQAFVESKMQVTVLDVNEAPTIDGIPDISLHYDVFTTYHLEDYVVDDNETEDLRLWTSASSDGDIEVDPANNLALILWFPQQPVMPYDVTVTVWVTDGEFIDSDEFVVTVTEFYPVLLKYQIEDVEFDEDTNLTNAFNLWDHFEDLDGGSYFEFEGYNTDNLTVEIIESDGLAMVNFYPARDFYGTEKVKFIGVDTKANSQASDTISVYVRPVNDPPVISDIPDIKVEVDRPTQFNLEEYISDIDDAIYNLTVTIDDVNVEVNGRVLTFNYTKTGTITLTVTVNDGEAQVSKEFKVIVEERSVPTILDFFVEYWWLVILLIIVIFILVSTLYARLYRYTVEEVYLIHKSGILVVHRMRKPSTEYDEEIVSGMFTAVQEFIKDTFSGRAESDDDYALQDLTLGENRVLLDQGEYLNFLVIFSGRGIKRLRAKTTKLLKDIETKYLEPLQNWIGDMDKFRGIEKMLKVLIPKEEALSEEEDPSKKGVDMLHTDRVPPPPAPPSSPSPPPTASRPPPVRPSPPPPTTQARPPPRPVPTPQIKPKPQTAKQPVIKQTQPVPKIKGVPAQPKLPPVEKK